MINASDITPITITSGLLDFDTFGRSHSILSSDVMAAVERSARIVGDWVKPARPIAVDLNEISAAVQSASYAFYNADTIAYEEDPVDALRQAMVAFRRLIDKQGVTALDAEVMCEIIGHVQIAINNIKDSPVYSYFSEHGMTADALAWTDAMELFSHPEKVYRMATKIFEQGLQEDVTLDRIYGHIDSMPREPIEVEAYIGRITHLKHQLERDDQCVQSMMKIARLIEAEMVEYEDIITSRHDRNIDDGSDFNPAMDLTLLRLRAQDLRHRCMIIGHQIDAAQAEIVQLQDNEISW